MEEYLLNTYYMPKLHWVQFIYNYKTSFIPHCKLQGDKRPNSPLSNGETEAQNSPRFLYGRGQDRRMQLRV